MSLIRTTDYFAAIPHDQGVGVQEINLQPGTDGPPKSASAGPMSEQAFRHHVRAEVSLVALVLITAIAVGTVVINW